MNTLLLFFALPVATFILAIVLEKILRCPFLTSATFFAIFLIVAFSVFDASFLIFVIVYTVIAFIAAAIAEFFFRRFCCNGCRKRSFCECLCQNDSNENNSNSENTIRLSDRDINAIARQVANIQNNQNCGCSHNSVDTVAVNVRDVQTGNRTSWCCYRK